MTRTPAEGSAAAPETVKSGLPSRLVAGAVLTLRFLVVPALIAAAVLASRDLPGISSLPDSGVRALLPTNTPAARAKAQAQRLFGSSLLPRIAVVERNPQGCRSPISAASLTSRCG